MGDVNGPAVYFAGPYVAQVQKRRRGTRTRVIPLSPGSYHPTSGTRAVYAERVSERESDSTILLRASLATAAGVSYIDLSVARRGGEVQRPAAGPATGPLVESRARVRGGARVLAA